MKLPRLIVAALFAVAGAAFAQGYPAKPVKVVVPWPPGGTTDAAGRVIAQHLSARLSNPFDVFPPVSREDFQKFVGEEMVRWGEVIKRANIRLEQK